MALVSLTLGFLVIQAWGVVHLFIQNWIGFGSGLGGVGDKGSEGWVWTVNCRKTTGLWWRGEKGFLLPEIGVETAIRDL